jgi:leucyl-tRNA synthetase
MEYAFQELEKKWQARWEQDRVFQAETPSDKPKYYVLDMFPYPSGAGLHVGHPLGYIASDIVARFQKLKGFNVLHPMGFDAFGLPAEQYAIENQKHPADTTAQNIARYREQLRNLGLAYDWSREVVTSDPKYYQFTQWIFLQLFNHWFDTEKGKPQPISALIQHFEKKGSQGIQASADAHPPFSSSEWLAFSPKTQSDILMCYRLAYQSYAYVNWCEALGTVLANDEVKDGRSERGNHPVERKQLRQWFLRITAYADRLLSDLETLGWSEAMKDMQRNWIGKSVGASVQFELEGAQATDKALKVFTTRPDTLFGVTFLVVAPESEWAKELASPEQMEAVMAYVVEAKNRSERERQANVEQISGVFTGSYAIHPLTGEKLPVWVGDYVLAGYGTGVVMAVPAHDARDFRFAKHFQLPIRQVITDDSEASTTLTEAYEAKEGQLIQSDFLNGLQVKDAMKVIIDYLVEHQLGQKEIQFRLRDANFSRQRYWGEPFPICYREDVPEALPETDLPLHLPAMDDFRPTGKPESPLTKLTSWTLMPDGRKRETDTMPGYAGSSWYFLRYMDAKNPDAFAGKEALSYWKDVDLYIGGTEHAVGHLLYARFWHKFLFDLGHLPTSEPFKKLVNQGMIQGRSNFVYRLKERNAYVSAGLKNQYPTQRLHVDVNLVQNDVLNVEAFKQRYPDAAQAEFILENGQYHCDWEVEKMSKSKYNVVNPDAIVDQYGADTLRMYEMFLGPVEQSKPWNTQGIEGVHKFLRKLWKACVHSDGSCRLTDSAPDPANAKALHKLLKKIPEDIGQLSLNTCISAFMICLNEWIDRKASEKALFQPFLIALSPFAPHIAEELWAISGGQGLIAQAKFPEFDPEALTENHFDYPVSFNGKVRFKFQAAATASPSDIETAVLSDPQTVKWLEGKTPKKVIVVPGRIINLVY